MKWQIKKFEDVGVGLLYEILHLRSRVFHVEQSCAYNDLDHKDQAAWHVLGFNEKGELIAYARLIPAGISFKDVSIGRVITSPEERGKGVGKSLMQFCIKQIHQLFGPVPIRIGAQCYLDKFYREFGFIPQGMEYLEDNIPHIEMLRNG